MIRPVASSQHREKHSLRASVRAGLAYKEAWIALVSLTGSTFYIVVRFLFHAPKRYSEAFLIAVLVGRTPLLSDLLKKLVAREVGSDALAGISIVTSAILGEYLAGAIIVLMLAGGTALEFHATRRASAVLSALAKRLPRTAHQLAASGIVKVRVADVRVDDRLVVLPHEICPADGSGVDKRIRSGSSPNAAFCVPAYCEPGDACAIDTCQLRAWHASTACLIRAFSDVCGQVRTEVRCSGKEISAYVPRQTRKWGSGDRGISPDKSRQLTNGLDVPL
jgi:hypothetical protein